jgi:hypothetical protein
MRKIAFVIIGFKVLLIIGCKENEVYQLIPEKYQAIYKPGDTLIYKAGSDYDTFYYKRRDGGYFVYGKYHTERIFNQIFYNNFYFDSLPEEFNYVYEYVRVRWLAVGKSVYYIYEPDIDYMTINGKIYSDVFEINKNAETDTNITKITKIYFTYKYWIIRYIEKDSIIWDLYKY